MQFAGYNGLSRKDPSSSKRQIVYDEMSSRPRKRLNTAETVGVANPGMDGNVKQKNGSSNPRGLGTSHEIHSSHQPMKRALPASLQPSTSSMRSNNLVEMLVQVKFVKRMENLTSQQLGLVLLMEGTQ
ncbi:UNVERIFIED_CONTAM: hypothetical protein Sangu_2942800 [Sesamum angustifolium]|uniref:Uncharacterized protein n=1 Tax=Sesamum angustifolium TaxID=2727405 RepID=A0AAW2IL62_9LAMI